VGYVWDTCGIRVGRPYLLEWSGREVSRHRFRSHRVGDRRSLRVTFGALRWPEPWLPPYQRPGGPRLPTPTASPLRRQARWALVWREPTASGVSGGRAQIGSTCGPTPRRCRLARKAFSANSGTVAPHSRERNLCVGRWPRVRLAPVTAHGAPRKGPTDRTPTRSRHSDGRAGGEFGSTSRTAQL
jgi:hypothetical protein